MLFGIVGPAVAVKLVVAPALVGGAGLAGRRWGERVAGWLVALPLTSGPVAFFLAREQGVGFAARAAVAMLAGTVSQVVFAVAYRYVCRGAAAVAGEPATGPVGVGRGWPTALTAGSAGFAVTTAALAGLRWPALPTFVLVLVVLLAAGTGVRRRRATSPAAGPGTARWWELPARMAVATGVVVAVTALAPRLGAHLAGLLSPFPVFGAVMAVFAHRSVGAAAAAYALGGLVLGLASPTVFFFALAVGLPVVGLPAFAVAATGALLTQACTAWFLTAGRGR